MRLRASSRGRGSTRRFGRSAAVSGITTTELSLTNVWTPSAARVDRAWRSFGLHAGAVSAVALVRFADDSGLLTLILGGLICAVTYGHLAYLESRSADHRLTLLSWLFAFSALSSGLSPILLATYLLENGYLPFVTIGLESASLASGYLIFLIGQVFFHFGYLVRAHKRVLFLNWLVVYRGRGTSHLSGVILLWLIGIFAILFPDLVKGAMGSVGGVFERGNMAALAFLALRGPESFGLRRGSWWMLLLVGSAGSFAASLTQNSKFLILLSLLPVCWYLARSSWKRVTAFALVVLTIYSVVIHPVVTIARHSNDSQGIDYVKHLFDTYERTGGLSGILERFGGPLQSAHDMVMRPFQGTVIGFVFEEADRTGFRHGQTFEGAWFAFIPRILWPDKPNVTRGGVWREYISGAMGGGGISLSAQGELYWNWGALGVAVGMILLGALYGELVKLTGDPLGGLIRMLLHLNLILSVQELTDVLSTVVGLVAAFGLFGFMIFFSERIVGRRREIASLFTRRKPLVRLPIILPARPSARPAEASMHLESAGLGALIRLWKERGLSEIISGEENRRRDLTGTLAAVTVLAARARIPVSEAWAREGAGARFDLPALQETELHALLSWLGARRERIDRRVRKAYLGETGYSGKKTIGLFLSVPAVSEVLSLDAVLDVDGIPLEAAVVKPGAPERFARTKRGLAEVRGLGLETAIFVGFRPAPSAPHVVALSRAERRAFFLRRGREVPEAGLFEVSPPDAPGKRYVVARQPENHGDGSLDDRLFRAEKSLRSIWRKAGREAERAGDRAFELAARRVTARHDLTNVLVPQVTAGGLEIVRDLDALALETRVEGNAVFETSEPASRLSASEIATAGRVSSAASAVGQALGTVGPGQNFNAEEQDGLAVLGLVALHLVRFSEPGLE